MLNISHFDESEHVEHAARCALPPGSKISRRSRRWCNNPKRQQVTPILIV